MLLDYILTYTGIHVFECITEANKLMVGFMELDFTTGILIRLLQCGLVVFLYFVLKNEKYKKYKIVYDTHLRMYSVKKYCVVELEVDGEAWGIFVPPYETETFKRLLGVN